MQVSRHDLMKSEQMRAWHIQVLRVQMPGSHSSEYQWQFDYPSQWTDEEMASIEEALLDYMSPQANATWKFFKRNSRIYATRPNWRFTVERSTAEEVATYIHAYYRMQQTLLAYNPDCH